MRIKWSILIPIFLVCFLVGSSLAHGANVVVPTYYGYGVINSSATCVKPYISSCYPYEAPVYYPVTNYAVRRLAYHAPVYNAYATPVYSTYSAPVYTTAVCNNTLAATVPTWNGAFWSYVAPALTANLAASTCNLNIRSAPYVTGKKKRSNVISSLKSGEQAYVLSQTGNWFYVQSVYPPVRRGYVHGAYLRVYNQAWPTGTYTVFHPRTLFKRTSW
jgi:uncharacterized protein YgiM (DUF1202 family)